MKLFTDQEKLVLKFIIGTAVLGIIIGFARRNFSDDVISDDRAKLKDNFATAAENIKTEQDEESTIIQSTEIVNINTAKKEDLMRLPKVGPVTAERIIRYREDYGYFKTVDDLLNIKGIGPKTILKLKQHVTTEKE